MRFEPLSRKLLPHRLIFSEAGNRLFATAAWFFCVSLVTLYAGEVLRATGITRGHIPILENAFSEAVLTIIAVLSGITLLYGMQWHLADSPDQPHRTFWSMVLIAGVVFCAGGGALVYYLAVYRKDLASAE